RCTGECPTRVRSEDLPKRVGEHVAEITLAGGPGGAALRGHEAAALLLGLRLLLLRLAGRGRGSEPRRDSADRRLVADDPVQDRGVLLAELQVEHDLAAEELRLGGLGALERLACLGAAVVLLGGRALLVGHAGALEGGELLEVRLRAL